MKVNSEKKMRKGKVNIVERILEENRHDRYRTDIVLGLIKLNDFIVFKNVLRPELVTSIYLAKYLAANSGLYFGKTVIDMGAGTGIQGVVMGLSGASNLIFTDVLEVSYENCLSNIEHYNLKNNTQVIKGDLFSEIDKEVDIVVFNHPFFPAEPTRDDPISIAIMDTGPLLHNFLEQVPNYARRIVMPFFHLAGEVNDPGIQAPKHGYKLVRQQQINSTLELHPGAISIYVFDCP